MIIFAVLTDLTQTFLTWTIIGTVFTPFISIFALMVLGLSFAHYGVSMYKPATSLRWIGTSVGEIVPGLNALPLWTFSTIITIVTHKLGTGREAV